MTANNVKLMTPFFIMDYILEHPHKDTSGTMSHCDDTNKFAIGHSYIAIYER